MSEKILSPWLQQRGQDDTTSEKDQGWPRVPDYNGSSTYPLCPSSDVITLQEGLRCLADDKHFRSKEKKRLKTYTNNIILAKPKMAAMFKSKPPIWRQFFPKPNEMQPKKSNNKKHTFFWDSTLSGVHL